MAELSAANLSKRYGEREVVRHINVRIESGEVVVLRTRDASGPVHETRVWVADEAGFAWLEAATRPLGAP